MLKRGLKVSLGTVIIVAGLVVRGPHTFAAEPGGKSAEAGVRQASDQFYAALGSMLAGDATPLGEVWSHAADVTNMGPIGDRQVGWEAVKAQFDGEAKRKMGGSVSCKDLLVRATANLGYTLCVEHGEQLSARGKPIVVEHRVTNIFRREQGKWKLVHHHTDQSGGLQATVEMK